MHPPSWVCQRLYRMEPKLRLGWQGRDPRELEDGTTELNPGNFAIVGLRPRDVHGKDENPNTMREMWDCQLEMVGQGKLASYQTVRRERGPLFTKNGDIGRDWDTANLVPVYLVRLSKEEVMTGRFLDNLVEWKTPVSRRIREAHREKVSRMEADIKDKAGAAADYLWSLANNADAAVWNVPKRGLSPEDDPTMRDFYKGKLDISHWLNPAPGLDKI